MLDGSWSIINEVVFYILFPLIVNKFSGIAANFKLYCLSLILMFVFAISVSNIYPGYSYYGFPAHFPTFILGIIAYNILKNDKIFKILYENKIYIFLISLIIMIGNLKTEMSHNLFGIKDIYSISFFLILITSLTLSKKIPTLFGSFLSFLGKQTYSLYFTHLILIKLWVFYFDNFLDYNYSLNLITNLIICIPISIIFSHLFFNKIDLFFVSIGKKISN